MTIRKMLGQLLGTGALFALLVGSAQAALGPNLLENGGFETPSAVPFNVGGSDNWTTFNDVFTNNTAGVNFGPVSHDAGGTQSLLMFGPFFAGFPAAGAYQSDNAVIPGVEYEASVWVMNWVGDPFQNIGILQLNFWDAAGGQLGPGSQISGVEINVDPFGTGDVDLTTIEDGAEISDWTQLSVRAVAPVGAVSAEVFLLHVQSQGAAPFNGGTLRWDDANLAAVPVPADAWLMLSCLAGLVGAVRLKKS